MKRTRAPIYEASLSLLTDLYQLTMANGYWMHGKADQEAIFHLFFRKNPFQGGYTVVAGLENVLNFIREFRLSQDDLTFLADVRGNDNEPLFGPKFLQYLSEMRLTVDVDAMPEGTVAFPHEPLLRVSGPIIQCQLLETALLNMVNFQSLVATKATRICLAARGDAVLEFGLRRAQGIDGGLTASRAAYIGGCSATSNVLAGKTYGIPIKGTHAHSWVMSFDSELSAFESYSEAMPNNCVFLVDTYDTLEGVRKAVRAGQALRERGFEMTGIRLDSGDLAYLSIEARKILDTAGFPDATIVASNDLDEYLIESLKRQHARINVWGVGTKLVTAYDQPALGGVYKFGALRDPNGAWVPKVKLSEQLIKTSTPGSLQVRRYFDAHGAAADMIINELTNTSQTMIDPLDPTHRRNFDDNAHSEDLLKPVVRGGAIVNEPDSLPTIRGRVQQQLELFHSGVLRLENPHKYPVGLEASLFELKSDLALIARDTTLSDN